MTTKWSSYRGVPLLGHLHVADQQQQKNIFYLNFSALSILCPSVLVGRLTIRRLCDFVSILAKVKIIGFGKIRNELGVTFICHQFLMFQLKHWVVCHSNVLIKLKLLRQHNRYVHTICRNIAT